MKSWNNWIKAAEFAQSVHPLLMYACFITNDLWRANCKRKLPWLLTISSNSRFIFGLPTSAVERPIKWTNLSRRKEGRMRWISGKHSGASPTYGNKLWRTFSKVSATHDDSKFVSLEVSWTLIQLTCSGTYGIKICTMTCLKGFIGLILIGLWEFWRMQPHDNAHN